MNTEPEHRVTILIRHEENAVVLTFTGSDADVAAMVKTANGQPDFGYAKVDIATYAEVLGGFTRSAMRAAAPLN